VYFPDPLNNTTAQAALQAGKIAVNANGWSAYQLFWDAGRKLTPPTRFGALHPFSHDGQQPVWHQYEGPLGKTVIKQGTPARVTELLGILNYLAAPFGSEEYQLLNYGLRGTHFDFDANGNPAITETGQADLNVNGAWQYTVTPVQVLFDPNNAEFVKAAYADEQALVPSFVRDPTAGLYAPTDAAKGGQLTRAFSDGLGLIVTGQNPLSALDQLIGAWRTTGGDQIRSEYQAAYARAQA
jgi:putative aldouronate transport system substrate-binding protein